MCLVRYTLNILLTTWHCIACKPWTKVAFGRSVGLAPEEDRYFGILSIGWGAGGAKPIIIRGWGGLGRGRQPSPSGNAVGL